MRKRARSASARGRRSRFPSRTYGTAHIPRGGAYTLSRYGATAASANATQLAHRRMDGWTGRGGYLGDMVGRGMNYVGGMLTRTGNPYASAAGALLSGASQYAGRAEDMLAKTELGAKWRRLTGQGAYAGGSGSGGGASGVVGNQIIAGSGAPPPTSEIPRFNTGSNNVVISHKEFIGDLYAPAEAGTFTNRVLPLNPGLSTTFPWLSQVAANYDEFTIHQLVFTYRPSISDFVATNGQVGMVIMATQYNASDPPFESKQDMLEYDLAMDCKVSQHMYHGVECDPTKLSMGVGKYTRAGPAPHGEDLKTYDHGVLNIGVSNCPPQFTNQALGELWVTYTVELRKPKFFVTRGLAIQRDSFTGATPTDQLPTGVIISSLQWGRAEQNRIGGSLRSYSTLNGVNTWLATKDLFFTGYGVAPGGAVNALGTGGNPYGPAAKSALVYQFPLDFNGTVKLTFRATAARGSQDQPSVALYVYPVWSNNGMYYTNNAPSPLVSLMRADGSGNVMLAQLPDVQRLTNGTGLSGIADQWVPNQNVTSSNAFTWSPASGATDGEGLPTSNGPPVQTNMPAVQCELHLNVVSPQTANTLTPNQVGFILWGTTYQSQTGIDLWTSMTLDVEIYNGGQGAGSFNQTGAVNNVPTSGVTLVNPNTGVPIGWPLGGGLIPNSV